MLRDITKKTDICYTDYFMYCNEYMTRKESLIVVMALTLSVILMGESQ